MAKSRIITNPDLMLGKPTIEGTRITVEFILEQLECGRTVEQLMQHYGLTLDEINAALQYAAEAVRLRQRSA